MHNLKQRPWHLPALAAGAFVLLSCGGAKRLEPAAVVDRKAADPAVDSTKVKRGREAIASLKRGLMRALMGVLPRSGPVSAIAVCKDEAPRIASAIKGQGVEVGRTSHRLRNLGNAPRAWVEPLLRAYLAKPRSTDEWRAVPLSDGAVGVVEPIGVKGPCLRCHGSDLTPEVRARLKHDYPNDRATGFSAGDLRGLFWAEVK